MATVAWEGGSLQLPKSTFKSKPFWLD